MGADQQNDVSVGVVGAGTVIAHPELIARPRARGADVGVRVVTVDSPCGQDALCVAILTRTADVIHDIVRPPLLQRSSDARGDVIERFIPAHFSQPILASASAPPKGMEDTVRIIRLIECGRTLCTVPSTGSGMFRVA